MLRKHFLATCLAAALFVTSGCIVSFITPKAADLRQVHDAYSREFTALNLGEPKKDAARAAPRENAAFAQSLRAIQDYRRRYPGDTAELAHLQVLEGMIYLQSGRFGLAEAIQPEVARAAGKLSSATGLGVRDQLFAQNFSALVAGWTEAKKTAPDPAKLLAVADQIAAALRRIPADKLGAADAADGAGYLATTAAIFYVTAAAESLAAPAQQRELFEKGAEIIGRFLTPAEKSPGVANDVADVTSGRLRYVRWYHWLRTQVPAG